MRTATHYTDAQGQHELPIFLRWTEITDGKTIITADELDECTEPEVAEVKRVLRGLGYGTEINSDGDLVAVKG